jgi:hypothetical protein
MDVAEAVDLEREAGDARVETASQHWYGVADRERAVRIAAEAAARNYAAHLRAIAAIAASPKFSAEERLQAVVETCQDALADELGGVRG